MNEFDELLKIYDLKALRTYEKVLDTLEKTIKDSTSGEFRFRKMKGTLLKEYYDCLELRAETPSISIPSLSGAEGWRMTGSGGAEAIRKILEKEERSADIRISRVISHENLYWVFVKGN